MPVRECQYCLFRQRPAGSGSLHIPDAGFMSLAFAGEAGSARLLGLVGTLRGVGLVVGGVVLAVHVGNAEGQV